MDGLKDFVDQFLGQSQLIALVEMIGQDMLPTVHLNHRQTLFFFVFTDLTGDIHAACQQLKQFIVDERLYQHLSAA